MRARTLLVLIAALAAGGFAASPAGASPIGTTFGFQGRLLRNGTPIQGTVDFRYTLWDDALAGAQQGPTLTQLGIVVADGLVSTSLDFGAVFDGNRRWLAVEVQGQGDVSFVPLTPRQEILAVPYALWSGTGGGGLQLPYIGVLSAGLPLFEVRNTSNSTSGLGLRAETEVGAAVEGLTHRGDGDAVHGVHIGDGSGSGVHGEGQQYQIGVLGTAQVAPGVQGVSQSSDGVHGSSSGPAAGVLGENNTPYVGATGVTGRSSSTATGVYGYSNGGYGVLGETAISNKAGVKGITSNSSAYGGWFENTGSGGVALYVDGTAQVTGEAWVAALNITGGADLAERFETSERAEPGTVLVIDPDSPGRLKTSDEPYSRRVAGVVSGANALAAGVVLGCEAEPGKGQPVALTGRVWVRCDAGAGPIHAGDLLTTAPRRGYAMKAADARRATGAILGKAMTSLEAGSGLVLVLVSLQ